MIKICSHKTFYFLTNAQKLFFVKKNYQIHF